MRRHWWADMAEEPNRPADSRDGLQDSQAVPGELRPQIARCQWCGREVADGWTPERSADDQLCARCLHLVRDPDAWRE